eukprot:9457833-Ditylum_brightwellii.AAC.1
MYSSDADSSDTSIAGTGSANAAYAYTGHADAIDAYVTIADTNSSNADANNAFTFRIKFRRHTRCTRSYISLCAEYGKHIPDKWQQP